MPIKASFVPPLAEGSIRKYMYGCGLVYVEALGRESR